MPKAKALQRARHKVNLYASRTVTTAQAVVRDGVCYARNGKKRAAFPVVAGVSDGQKLVVAYTERYCPVSTALKITVSHWKTQNSTGARKRRMTAIKARIFHAVGAWESTPQYGVFRVIARTDAQRQALLKIQDDNADILTVSEF